MNPILKYCIICIGIIVLIPSCATVQQSKENISVENLRCEMRHNPEGIDAANPKLSWVITAEQRNIEQTAYQILVATSPEKLEQGEGDLWNSGKIMTNQSIHVPYQGQKLKSRMPCYWKVKVWTKNGESPWSKPAYWSMGLLHYKDWAGRWIGFDHAFPWEEKVKFPTLAARYFRTAFEVKPGKEIKRASAYIMGLGLYEMYINGEKIGKQVLSPSPTDYTKNVKYNTFDVTANLTKGENAVGIVLGAGRYSAMRPNYKPYKIKDFGFPKLLFNLYIEYADGTKDVVRTTNQWKGTADGPIRANNEYDGETYDARKEFDGWTQPGFDDSQWLTPEYVQEPRGEFEAQMNENMQVMDTVHPVSIKEPKPGVFIMDMGQNMAGWVTLKVRGKRGNKVTLRFAEALTNGGELFTAPLRDAKATDTYILKGKGVETWHPIFTYHGFRYVEITGYPGTPQLKDFKGCVVYDNMQTMGQFETSNKLLNQIYQNAFWTINATYKGMPIDCPQRNERMPWLGDRAIGCYGESFVLDNSKLYLKWLEDIRNSQKSDGCISDVAPPYFRYYSDNMTWPGTYLFVADMLYRQYGLTDAVSQHYPAMKKWLNYMMDRYMEGYILIKDSYGDWCEPPRTIEAGRGKNANVKHPSKLIATAYLYQYLHMMQDFASITGHKKDIIQYRTTAHSVKTAFNQAFYHADSAYYGNRKMTENLLPLAFGLVPGTEKQKVVASLKDIVMIDNNGHLSVGLVGAQWLMRTLTENGMADIAYKLATNTTYPSWGYMVENGATTIWELWNATTAAPKMNSQNHVMMLGDLIIWYNQNLAGIKTSPRKPGFKEMVVQPIFPEGLGYVKASYRTPYGTVKSHWGRTVEGVRWNVQVPANTTAKIILPKKQCKAVTENGITAEKINGVRSVTDVNGNLEIEIGSGDYNFEIKRR